MRPSRHQMFLAMARAAASRATCYRLNVGAVIVDHYTHNVVAVGYNGAAAGEPHCGGNGCRYYTPNGCKVVHAEENAIDRARDSNAVLATLYVTHSPCSSCARLIIDGPPELAISRGPIITAIYFEASYRDPGPVKALLDADKEVYQVLPSGLMVNCLTGELCDP